MAVTSMMVGAQTPDGATFVARVTGGGPVRVAVSTDPGMGSPVFTSSQAVDAQGVAKVAIIGLAADTRHWWQVEDNGTLDTGVTGQVLTDPPLGTPASFTVAMASCAGGAASVPGPAGALAPERISDHAVFDTIRTAALAGNWRRWCHLGDMHYYDPGSGVFVPDASLTTYRRGYDDILLTRQHQLYREVGLNYIWDDHDFGPNNSDGTFVDKANAAQVYRERVPHVALPDPDAIYHSFQIGRALFVGADVRYDRSPNSDPDGPGKTMLGVDQKAWLETLLTTTDAKLLVWMMGSQWRWPDPVSGVDTWAPFATERDELATMLGDTGWLGRMCMVYGDRHAAGIDSGGSNQWGGFPLLVASSLDSDTGANLSGFYDILDDTNGRNQYGTVAVQDHGSHIAVRLTAWRGTQQLGSYPFGINVSTPILGTGALLRTLSGSHRATFEARVLTTFQSGEDPGGVEIPILAGDVQMDGTAQIQRTLELTTAGIDPGGSRSMFPRRATDLLAPYGNELFIRRGVDVGSQIIWFPLGYFRITAAEQDDAPYGDIRLSGQDRMASILAARPLQPREFPATRTVASVFAELVGEVYPDAVIVFDDDSAAATIGRVLVMEEDRHAPLAEIATSLGKIMHWDGAGSLQVRTAPDESTPVWEVRAGLGGVMFRAGRRVSDEGVFNGVVATGEAGETDTAPARGVAVDLGPNSPTRWGGRFGKRPRFYASPFIKTNAQALTAATEMLRRSLGAPYSVDFGSVVNPALQPYDPILAVQRDGNQELHVMQRLTIPLVAGPEMSGTTRQKTLVVIGGAPE